MIKGEHNYGFAKGNNKLIEIALQRKYEYVALLNNDTVLTAPLFLNCVKAFELNPSYSIFTANICYFHSAKTWNAGGIIFAGYHKYFTTKYINKRRKRRLIPTQFVSGCFFIAKSEIFKKYGGLSERFFFGEEDYEFSYRMKKNKIKMGVLTSETLYHKIGSSVGKKSNTDQIGRKLVYYLNKYIDTKTFYSSQLWFFWRLLSNSLIFIKNIRKIGIQGTVVFLETLNHLAKTRNALDFNATFKIWEINTLDELKQLKKYSIEEEHQCR